MRQSKRDKIKCKLKHRPRLRLLCRLKPIEHMKSREDMSAQQKQESNRKTRTMCLLVSDEQFTLWHAQKVLRSLYRDKH